MAHEHEFAEEDARTIGYSIGIDWKNIDLEQFRLGLEVEMEHGSHDPETNVIGDDPHLAGRIAWAHLKEIPDYYSRLLDMEATAKEELGSNENQGYSEEQ